MQRILRVPQGLKAYHEAGDRADTPGDRECPFCSDHHPLRAHGWYPRWAYLPDGERLAEHQVLVRRFLCPHVLRTVSLLPDFCLPRRQYGPEALGLLLNFFALLGLSLLMAFRRLRPEVERHSVPQHLVAGFLLRRPQLTAYVGGLFERSPQPPSGIVGRRLEVARFLVPLCHERPSAAAALRHHGLPFHRRFALGLA